MHQHLFITLQRSWSVLLTSSCRPSGMSGIQMAVLSLSAHAPSQLLRVVNPYVCAALGEWLRPAVLPRQHARGCSTADSAGVPRSQTPYTLNRRCLWKILQASKESVAPSVMNPSLYCDRHKLLWYERYQRTCAALCKAPQRRGAQTDMCMAPLAVLACAHFQPAARAMHEQGLGCSTAAVHGAPHRIKPGLHAGPQVRLCYVMLVHMAMLDASGETCLRVPKD